MKKGGIHLDLQDLLYHQLKQNESNESTQTQTKYDEG